MNFKHHKSAFSTFRDDPMRPSFRLVTGRDDDSPLDPDEPYNDQALLERLPAPSVPPARVARISASIFLSQPGSAIVQGFGGGGGGNIVSGGDERVNC